MILYIKYFKIRFSAKNHLCHNEKKNINLIFKHKHTELGIIMTSISFDWISDYRDEMKQIRKK